MFYHCLVAIEKLCWDVFDGDSSQFSDVKNVTLDRALDDYDVRFYWDITIGKTSTKIGDDLLKMVIDLYTTIRGNAFAKRFVEQYKQKSSKNLKC